MIARCDFLRTLSNVYNGFLSLRRMLRLLVARGWGVLLRILSFPYASPLWIGRFLEWDAFLGIGLLIVGLDDFDS